MRVVGALHAGWLAVQTFCEWWLVAEQSAGIDGFVRATFPGAALLEHTAATFRYQVRARPPRSTKCWAEQEVFRLFGPSSTPAPSFSDTARTW